MAGFREFVTGEVLTAANVDDFLAKQAVMKFADAAARDSALGTAVAGGNALREGMVAYLDDTDDVLKYDGTSWATVANAGIGSNVVAASTSTIFNTSSSTFVDFTGITVTITPTTNTAKVYVLFTSLVSYRSGRAAEYQVMRQIGTGSFSQIAFGRLSTSDANPTAAGVAVTITDAPATTSAVTYKVQARCPEAAFVQFSSEDSTSGIVAVEVAA